MAAVAERSGVTRTAPNFSVRSSAFFSSIANILASARRNSGHVGASPSFVEVKPTSNVGTTISSVRVGASAACFSACSACSIVCDKAGPTAGPLVFGLLPRLPKRVCVPTPQACKLIISKIAIIRLKSFIFVSLLFWKPLIAAIFIPQILFCVRVGFGHRCCPNLGFKD